MLRFCSSFLQIWTGVLLLLATACTSVPKGTFQPVHTLMSESVQFRRPPGPSAIDEAGPGGIDYKSDPLPGKNFDCQPLANVLPATLNWEEIKTCLTAPLEKRVTLFYQLKREQQPYLELFSDEKEPPPECVQKLLSKIPVPREIFYVSSDSGELGCYSSRLNIEADKFFDTQMPSGEYAMLVDLPMRYPPRDADEARRLVLSWAITPIWNHETRQFDGRVFPDALCKRCMGEKALQPSLPRQVLTSWPPKKLID